MDLSVGQIIYLLANNEPKVYPVLVTEQIDKKTLSGNETTYVVRLPTEDEVEVPLEKLDVEVFGSVEDIKTAMVERARSQIDRILESSTELSLQFNVDDNMGNNGVSDQIDEPSGESESSDYAFIDMGDGVKGRIKTDELSKMQEAK